jgi:hypothetical protein
VQIIEIVGYAGSVLVAVSLMMSSVVKLRVINFVGALIFSIYGFIIGALPVGMLNGFIAIVDLYYIYDIFSAKELFKVLVSHSESDYLKYFFDYHESEIKKFFPSFEFSPGENHEIYFILRNLVPAGLVCAERINETTLFIKLDYAIPGYRDFKMGKYVYQKFLRESGIKKIYTDMGSEAHNKYLRRMGYDETTLEGKPVFLLHITGN